GGAPHGQSASPPSRGGASHRQSASPAARGVNPVPAASVPAAPPPPLHRQWDFGDLPESREVERNRLRLVVYPAVEDRGSGVVLIEARNATAAESVSRAGLVQ